MRDYYVHLVNFTENELIIDYVHESREINYLFHESREYFRSRITGNNFVLSRFTAVRNEHSRFTKNPLSDPLLFSLLGGKVVKFYCGLYFNFPEVSWNKVVRGMLSKIIEGGGGGGGQLRRAFGNVVDRKRMTHPFHWHRNEWPPLNEGPCPSPVKHDIFGGIIQQNHILSMDLSCGVRFLS